MEVIDSPNVWALGDCALVKQVDGSFSPPTAQHALRQGKTCAQNILASMRGTKNRFSPSLAWENSVHWDAALRWPRFLAFA